ncbi:MAG TPA: hypothetical protein VMD59_04470 [Acidimicrobiales bacterium]|nr:hypothetical protein [Acidimicrobiales bacterium]
MTEKRSGRAADRPQPQQGSDEEPASRREPPEPAAIAVKGCPAPGELAALLAVIGAARGDATSRRLGRSTGAGGDSGRAGGGGWSEPRSSWADPWRQIAPAPPPPFTRRRRGPR